MKHAQPDPLLATIVAINVGPGMFAESLRAQGVRVVQVDWVPPAGGEPQLLDLLDQLL